MGSCSHHPILLIVDVTLYLTHLSLSFTLLFRVHTGINPSTTHHLKKRKPRTPPLPLQTGKHRVSCAFSPPSPPTTWFCRIWGRELLAKWPSVWRRPLMRRWLWRSSNIWIIHLRHRKRYKNSDVWCLQNSQLCCLLFKLFQNGNTHWWCSFTCT